MESLLVTLHQPNLTWKERVAYLAHQMKQVEGLGVDELPVRHMFQKGIYIRDMLIPAGTIFVGRVHKEGHQVILLAGTVRLYNEQEYVVHEAPDSMITVPGYQTVFYTLTNVVGRTLHPNPDELRDINVLEVRIFEPAQEVLDEGLRVSRKLLS